jgi:hypothetical protein|nr:MAG TPA: hypothetical protein [Caudoviricetes sp.]
MNNFVNNDFINKISVNGVVAVSLCAALLICVCCGMIDLAQSLTSGLLGFLSRSIVKEK